MNDKIKIEEFEVDGVKHISVDMEYKNGHRIMYTTEEYKSLYVEDINGEDTGWIEDSDAPYPVTVFNYVGDNQDTKDFIMEVIKIKSKWY